MKENVLDVLIYLFETYANTHDQQDHSENQLLIKLRSAGFSHIEIDRAMDWLDSLVQIENKFDLDTQAETCTRIYNDIELSRLNSSCRGFISNLEHRGILSLKQREILIDRLLALETATFDIEQIKWIVLMLLFSQPGQEAAYSKMEDLVFSSETNMLH